ncbi:MAG: toll/interleukin-1 receptor domain-containing protein, partial [Chitinophagales bacterium]
MESINIFIAYSRQDTPYLQQLQVYLRPISRNKNIHIWYDGEIVPGTKWEESIKKHLYAADIILLMMSADALNSDFFYETEMKRALEQHQNGKSTVIPIILSHCLWDDPELQLVDLQALPQDGKPIKDWLHESKAYDNIARGIRRSIQLVIGKRKEEAAAKEKKIEAERKRRLAAAQAYLEKLQKEKKEEAERQRKIE